MILSEIQKMLAADVVCGAHRLDQDVAHAFASDLMSDVLTLGAEHLILITGLCNVQTIRTTEMANIKIIIFARGKMATPEMLELAEENEMILLQTPYSMFRTVGMLWEGGIKPVY